MLLLRLGKKRKKGHVNVADDTTLFQAMIFTNARLILPDGIRDGLEMVVEEGRIVAVRERSDAEAIDLGGNYLAPGFIDLRNYRVRSI